MAMLIMHASTNKKRATCDVGNPICENTAMNENNITFLFIYFLQCDRMKWVQRNKNDNIKSKPYILSNDNRVT